MNTNYNKKIENEEKKIAKFSVKINEIYNAYDVMPKSDDELIEADQRRVTYYREIIKDAMKRRDTYQEKALSQAQNGEELSSKKKTLISVVAIALAATVGISACNVLSKNSDKQKAQDDGTSTQTDVQDNVEDDIQNNDNIQFNNGIADGSLDDKQDVDKDIQSNSGIVDASLDDKQDVDKNVQSNGGIVNDSLDSEQGIDTKEENTKDAGSLEEVCVYNYDTVLTDIFDEDQVYARAKEIKEKYYDVYLPQQYVTQEEIEEQLRQINAGICKNVSFEAANNTIVVVNDLIFREEGDATDRVNGVETSREETPGTLDLGIFCLDGTKGQMLLHQISELRTTMIQGAGKTDISKEQKDFTRLFLSSTLLQGYESIDINSLETGGMKYLTSIAFFNTATLCGDFNQVKIEDPLLLTETTLASVIDRFNNATCETEVITENGEKTDKYEDINYMGSYLYEMVSDNYTTKSMYDEDFGHTLK